MKNKDLIYHLYEIFKSYVKTGPKVINKKLNKLTKGLHTDFCFSTLKYPVLDWFIEDYYIKVNNKNIKIVPKNSFDKLTSVSLAFWIMDDGSFNYIKGNLTLCTDSYSREEVLYLISILRDKYNLSCGLINYKKTKSGLNSYRIRINKKSKPYLIEITKPYFIPSMLY
uniref:LAGLIDADG endonuclease n=1 Tax=Phellinus igniarius TaxID=40472 RepID=UPI00233EF2E7|nr:LAGLIDADG endonuclease [Phellinus igniarius]WBU93167.1 LAGLIDADG endonuclease [Phellinus igniarius]